MVKPLSGLKVVSYYGCYLVRPRELTGFDDAENPQSMDRLMSALGAEALDWGGKVECCGGSGSFTDKGAVKSLVRGIMDSAREVKADLVVTACGLCQSNLESRQSAGRISPSFISPSSWGWPSAWKLAGGSASTWSIPCRS